MEFLLEFADRDDVRKIVSRAIEYPIVQGVVLDLDQYWLSWWHARQQLGPKAAERLARYCSVVSTSSQQRLPPERIECCQDDHEPEQVPNLIHHSTSDFIRNFRFQLYLCAQSYASRHVPARVSATARATVFGLK